MIEAFVKVAEVAKEVGSEGLKKASENLPSFANNYSNDNSMSISDADKPIGQKTFVDQSKTYISDKASSALYETKGLYNDMVAHRFYDPFGNPIEGKYTISDMIGDNGVKMPYIGSDKTNSNSAGYLRDNKYFWNKYKEQYGDTLSSNNVKLIEEGVSPIVDREWIKNNPNHKPYLGEKLEHHHRNNTDEAYAVPQTLHRGKFNKEIMHVD